MITVEPLSGNKAFSDLLMLCANMREQEIQQYESLCGPFDPLNTAIALWGTSGVRCIVYADDTPLVAGGWEEIVPGVWQSWMIGTESAWSTHWHGITRACRRIMDRLFDNGARRLQVIVLASRMNPWYERGLGMRFEGIHSAFGLNGEDVAEYGKVHPELVEVKDGARWQIK